MIAKQLVAAQSYTMVYEGNAWKLEPAKEGLALYAQGRREGDRRPEEGRHLRQRLMIREGPARERPGLRAMPGRRAQAATGSPSRPVTASRLRSVPRVAIES